MIGLLLARELTTSLRRTGFHVLVTAQAVAGLLVVFALEFTVRQLTPIDPPALGSTAATSSSPLDALTTSADSMLLLCWAVWLILASSLFIPALVGGAIARERERGTLSVILGAGASPGALVVAKLVASVLLMAGLVATGLPALGLALVFGAPPISVVAASGLVVLAWGGLVVCLGLVASALTRSSSAGIAGALLAAGMLLALTLAVPTIAPSLGANPPAIIYRLNPLSAAMLADPEAGRRILELVGPGPWAAALVPDSSHFGPTWWPFVVASLAASTLLAAAASLIVGRSSSET